jgi:TetR/AcrR family transcriptional regulator
MPRPARVSPDRILAAAAAEFAARGYAGARVDRIARRARVNKAMLYYHFGSKQALYRALLRETFAAAAARLQAVVGRDAPADQVLDDLMATMHAVMTERSWVPAIMMREIAEGGTHLDRETLAAMADVPRTIGGFVQRGVQSGRFRAIHPFAAYLQMLAPLVMFLAAAPVRRELADGPLEPLKSLTPETFVRELQHSIRRALEPPRRHEP